MRYADVRAQGYRVGNRFAVLFAVVDMQLAADVVDSNPGYNPPLPIRPKQ